MKLTYNPQNDRIELRNLIRALILQHKGRIMSGMSCRVLFNDLYGIDIDHHEYAYALDNMTRTDEVKFYAHHDGDTQYIVNA